MSEIPLVVASGNTGKIKELGRFFETLQSAPGIPTWVLQAKPDQLDIEETGTTFAANAVQKAVGIALATRQWAIADDSGLCVDGLGGAPGVYSARYAPTDQERNLKLLAELKQVLRQHGQDPDDLNHRTASFECAIALSDPDGQVRIAVTGSCPGQIALSPSGAGGFGYDPLFWVPELRQTFAEMDPADKARIGHRGRALQLFKTALQQDWSEDWLNTPQAGSVG
ncbi:MAG: RdgB/HAM1 family non-canonical purine NTP pyrophosphatase [Synechococcaceae cyanobacterium RM1_1_27]|nr:RdgB/HAM1 family non-canonical purine NTP pyrophosphatase [Synechococcaceae cyanobacterium SM2_3_2]NJO85566.1 RdgB/HAM1 family non-canonical purine NTP pyrophosphatase [Synechococcaceae cyanobacterium RM1_1_27]